MMRIIQMKNLTANPQRRRQDDSTGYIVEVTDPPVSVKTCDHVLGVRE